MNGGALCKQITGCIYIWCNMYKDSQQIPTFVLHVLCMTKYSYTLSFNLSFYSLCPRAIYLFRCAGKIFM